MSGQNLAFCAIYDFGVLPYALGDVLTWNVQTAVRCQEKGRNRVDIYVCMDPRYPSSIYQRDLVSKQNCGLFFSELYGAFGTSPQPGNIYIHSDRDELLDHLAAVSNGDAVNQESLDDYKEVISAANENALVEYFIKYIYSHNRINSFYDQRGDYPRLRSSLGCEPDVDALFDKVFAGKYVVAIHPRLRRLDLGFGGDHTYFRDSDFLEWYEFVRDVGAQRPDVQFVVTGRLTEKPLALLRLPNVTSLRTLGMGLGHELTLLLKANLFIGTSSGFGAMVNFSRTPYFLTKMNKESYAAYQIPEGAERLPFAEPGQILTAEPESAAMLARLLEKGLEDQEPQPGRPLERATELNSATFAKDGARWLAPHATTARFFCDDDYADQETAFLVAPRLKRAMEAVEEGRLTDAEDVVHRIHSNFPRLQGRFPELAALEEFIGAQSDIVSRLLKRRQARANLRHIKLPEAQAKQRWWQHGLGGSLLRGFGRVVRLPWRIANSARRGTLRSDIQRKLGPSS